MVTDLYGRAARSPDRHGLQRIDTILSERIDTIDEKDPARGRVMRGDMVFYVRQKTQDLLAQLVVNVQGYVSIDVIRSNNLELMRGVDRATEATVSALRTAVIVAQARSGQ
jgi:uncharacterized protein YaaN involved in tellurite resistance